MGKQKAIGYPIPAPKTTMNAVADITVPFRKATVERVEILPAENLTMTASTQKIERVIEGSGYVYGLMLNVIGTATSNSANVAFSEDAPWNALDSVVFRDVNGELVNLAGYDLYLANLINKMYVGQFLDSSSGFRNALPGQALQIASLPTALTPASVAANTTVEQTFGVGTLAGDIVLSVNKPTNQAGLAIGQCRNAGGAGLIGITFINDTAAAIVPTAAETYQVTVLRTQNAPGPGIAQAAAAAQFGLTAGVLGAAGSFNFWARVPVGINRRDLLAILGNQDRAQKYALRSDLAASGVFYTTAPTTLPTVVINKFYENYSVPLPRSSSGLEQAPFPPDFGTIHFTTSTLSDSAPQGSGTVNHFVRRIGNTVRWIALVFRSNGSRVTADAVANQPGNIRMKVGEDTIFNETYNYRRALMYERYGFDFPPGVLLYEAMHDFDGQGSGGEVGDDYWHTQALVNAQFQVTYPSGFGSTNNSLRIVVDDLTFVPPMAALPASA